MAWRFMPALAFTLIAAVSYFTGGVASASGLITSPARTSNATTSHTRTSQATISRIAAAQVAAVQVASGAALPESPAPGKNTSRTEVAGAAPVASNAPFDDDSSIDMRSLDELDDVTAWKARASDGVQATVHGAKGMDGGALVLEFDLANTAGYAAATRILPTVLPPDYEITLWIRGEAGRNRLEIKFVDASGDNVWWYTRLDFQVTGEWQPLRIRRRQIQFAWGPTQDRVMRAFQGIEFVLAAGKQGGRGSLWFDRFRIRPIVRPAQPPEPRARASSQLPGHEAALALDGRQSTSWRARPPRDAGDTLFEVDLGHPREFGGIEIDWVPGLHASRYVIETSMDERHWQAVRHVEAGNGGRDSYLLPESEARLVRLRIPAQAHERGNRPRRAARQEEIGIAEFHVRDLEFGASANAFIQALAKRARRGCYPRAFGGEQSYWTIIGPMQDGWDTRDTRDTRGNSGSRINGDPPAGSDTQAASGTPVSSASRFSKADEAVGGSLESLLSEDGALEPSQGSFTIEPFIVKDSQVLTWADVSLDHALEEGYLPIPSVEWIHASLHLQITAYAAGVGEAAHTRAVYRLRNIGQHTQELTLALAVRPFQVNPPAQFLNTAGGVSAIQDLSFREGRVWVDGVPRVRPLTPPPRFLAVTAAAGTPCEWLMPADSQARPSTDPAAGPAGAATGPAASATSSIRDDTGLASGALEYPMRLVPGEERIIELDLPLRVHAPAQPSRQDGGAQNDGAQHDGVRDEGGEGAAVPGEGMQSVRRRAPLASSLQEVSQFWREQLNQVELELPASAQPLVDTLRSSLAYVLINRDGAAIRPGARAYARSWIRDGAMTSEMLLRLGHVQEARDFLRWFAGYQFDGGKVPCCVDRRGADPVPENDSNGEFLFLVDAVHRYSGDRALLREMWPHVVSATAYMDELRLSQRVPENLEGERRAFYGLMPASISHEGYAAKPMHSYWDDFWALAGYESAVRIARALDEKEAMQRYIASRDEFRADVYRSLHVAMQHHDIDYLPGSAELGDFDATSTSIALSPVGEQQMLPPLALRATFERYWKNFDRRREDPEWDVYTPYEWRNVASFIRLGWRDRAWSLIEYFMNDRRPPAWNHWAEVVGRDARESRFIGDMPHGWVASDFARSLLDLLAYERQADEALVLMAGVPASWLESDGLMVRRLRTPYGPLSYSFTIGPQERVLEVERIDMPQGGIVVDWPGPAPEGHALRQGMGRWVGNELRITRTPFRMVMPR